ncbi:MAG: 2-phospho-L-lactate guanylyltransferase [Euryarchaeota archaeon]|nr:2-phospho-L-lactate guanylyltransferase [Euryarchaeota archaeon]
MEAGALRRGAALLLAAAYVLLVARASMLWLLENSALKPLGYTWLRYMRNELMAALAAAVLAFLILRHLEAGGEAVLCAVVPVNELRRAKSRLAGMLSPQERERLVLAMLEDVLSALRNSGVLPVLVSPEDLRGRVEGEFEMLVERQSGGLRQAVRLGNEHAVELGAKATLFLPADVPLLRRRHVREMLRMGRRYRVVVAPSLKGGISALLRSPPEVIPEVFSDRTFAEVRRVAAELGVELGVYDSFYLALDIDTPEDVREFMYHGEGTRTYRVLAEMVGDYEIVARR